MSMIIAMAMMSQTVTHNNEFGQYKGTCYVLPTSATDQWHRECFFDLVRPSSKPLPAMTSTSTERYSTNGWDCVEDVTILSGSGSLRSVTKCYTAK